jgi:hypothetical protein
MDCFVASLLAMTEECGPVIPNYGDSSVIHARRAVDGFGLVILLMMLVSSR